jgi:hypothetical protein
MPSPSAASACRLSVNSTMNCRTGTLARPFSGRRVPDGPRPTAPHHANAADGVGEPRPSQTASGKTPRSGRIFQKSPRSHKRRLISRVGSNTFIYTIDRVTDPINPFNPSFGESFPVHCFNQCRTFLTIAAFHAADGIPTPAELPWGSVVSSIPPSLHSIPTTHSPCRPRIFRAGPARRLSKSKRMLRKVITPFHSNRNRLGSRFVPVRGVVPCPPETRVAAASR